MFSDDEKKPLDDSRFRELSPGKLLVWARERAGLSQEQVAKELYMTLTKVRALESDDYRHMGSDTFTRGYLRSYATLVKLDVVQVLASYDRHAQTHGLVEQVLPQRTESPNKPLWQFIVLVLVALLVLWLISIWFFNNRQQPVYDRPVVPSAINTLNSQSLSPASVASSFLAAPLAQQVMSSAIGSISSAAQTQHSESVQSSKSAQSISSVASFATSSATAKVPAKQSSNILADSIEFNFSEECWLEVNDANGDALIADLQPAGASLKLQGKAPFDVKLGNAPAAKIELNGDRVMFVPALGTNVLSLKVGKTTRE